MRYFKVMFDAENEGINDIVCTASSDLVKINDLEKNAIYKGLKLDFDTNIAFTFNSSEGSNPTDYLGNNLMWPIFSWKAATIIQEICTNEVQMIPIKVIDNE